MTVSLIEKIVDLEELASITASLKKEGKKIVLCHGVFDLLHPGHIRHFEAAKREGDVLVVTVTPDNFVNKGPGRPVFNHFLRAESLAALKTVDYVAINRFPTAVEAIRMIKPDVYAKGSDYKNADDDVTGKITEEQKAVEESGGIIHFTRDITFSSSKLINDHFDIFSPQAKAYLEDFKKHYSARDILKKLETLKKLKVLVIGDVIIDEYHSCRAIGMASKSATLNAQYLGEEKYAGGALAVANHIAGFCSDVHLITCLGSQNPQREFIESSLKENISTTFVIRDDAPTTVKRRFVEPFKVQKMFEVTYLNDSPLPKEAEDELFRRVSEVYGQYDAILVCDFGHGMIGRNTAGFLSSLKANIALNAQTNSANFGHNPVTKYSRGNFICLDERELRLALSDKYSDIEGLVGRLRGVMEAGMVTVTRGQHGSRVFPVYGNASDTPVFTKEVVDTVGAGDAFFAVAAPCALSGFDPSIIGFLGNAAGAIASGIIGNKESVDPVVLAKYVETLLK